MAFPSASSGQWFNPAAAATWKAAGAMYERSAQAVVDGAFYAAHRQLVPQYQSRLDAAGVPATASVYAQDSNLHIGVQAEHGAAEAAESEYGTDTQVATGALRMTLLDRGPVLDTFSELATSHDTLSMRSTFG